MSNGIFLICFGILIIALGIFRINKPTFGWSFNESWKVKGESEPSDTYITAVKFGGVFVIMFGSVLILGGILNLYWIPSVHLILAACFRSSRDDVITLLPYLNVWIRSYWLVMSRANPFNPKAWGKTAYVVPPPFIISSTRFLHTEYFELIWVLGTPVLSYRKYYIGLLELKVFQTTNWTRRRC